MSHAMFGVLILGTLLEGRIMENALRELPGHFLPGEVSLKFVTSSKTLERHALEKGLPRRLSEARSAAHHQEEVDAIIQKAATTEEARD